MSTGNPPTEAEALRKLAAAMVACGSEPQRAFLTLSLRVKPSGDVAAVDVVTSTVASPGRIRCLREHLQAVPFAPFNLPPRPKSSAVSCADDSPQGMFGCTPLPYDAVTVGLQAVIDTGARVFPWQSPAVPTFVGDLPVELFKDDLRWAREDGHPQACIDTGDGKGQCFLLTSCSGPNGYAGLTNPRGSESGSPCDPFPKGKAELTTLHQALSGAVAPEVRKVRRP